MRRLAAFAALALSLFAFTVSAPAAANLRLDINSIEEKPGELAVSLNVVGSDGKPVAALNDGNFKAALNNGQVQVTSVQAADAARQPASVLLLVDVSGSMAGDPINQAKAAMQAFVQGLDPADSVAIIAFSAGVTPVADFTTDRAALNNAIASLPAVGDTALYDAVIAGAAKIATAPANGKRLIVLLSDGESTIGVDKRAASIAAVQQTGVSVVAIGEGPQIDRAYLGELATTSGGRFLEAPTPASLRQVYADLASTIRSQYTVVIAVPASVDRSLETKLSITASFRGDTGTVERTLAPLAGAAPPPFTLSLQGIKEGAKVKGATAITPVATGGVSLAKVEYKLDGELVQTATEAPFAASLDPAHLAGGSHTLVVIGTDARGRTGQAQVSFGVAVAGGGGSSMPSSLLLIVLLVIIFVGVLIFYVRKRNNRVGDYADRVKPWAGRIPVQNAPASRPMDWPEPPASAVTGAVASTPPADVVLGRIILMNEDAVREGALDAIQEVEIKSTPLTFGSGANCDLRVDDLGGRIAAEEARLWIQKGRLVYHKLTTLSAMATEGVTSGWEFLDSGEDMHVGPYRLMFQAAEVEAVAEPEQEPTPTKLPQEHGMELRDLWTRVVENEQQYQSPPPPNEPYDPLLDDPSLTPQP